MARIAIDDIRVGDRIREDKGDIAGMAASYQRSLALVAAVNEVAHALQTGGDTSEWRQQRKRMWTYVAQLGAVLRGDSEPRSRCSLTCGADSTTRRRPTPMRRRSHAR